MKKIIAFSIDEILITKLSEVARILGLSRSEMVEQLIARYLEHPDLDKKLEALDKLKDETLSLVKA